MYRYAKGLLIAVFSAGLLAGCAEGVLPPDKPDDEPAEVVEGSGGAGRADQGDRASTQPLPSQRGFEGDPLDDPDSILVKRVVYFDFDSANVRAEDRPIIEAHAEYLATRPNIAVTLEGHADERGSREYNIGLGERRALAVRRLVTLLGVSDGQVRTVSFGEERPAALGHDEASWWQNRRVELNYER